MKIRLEFECSLDQAQRVLAVLDDETATTATVVAKPTVVDATPPAERANGRARDEKIQATAPATKPAAKPEPAAKPKVDAKGDGEQTELPVSRQRQRAAKDETKRPGLDPDAARKAYDEKEKSTPKAEAKPDKPRVVEDEVDDDDDPDPTDDEEREAIQAESKSAVAAAILHGEGVPAAIADARRLKDLIEALWDEGIQDPEEMVRLCEALQKQGHRAVKRAVNIDDRIRRSIERMNEGEGAEA